MNVLDRVSKKHQAVASRLLRQIHFSKARKEAEEHKRACYGCAYLQGYLQAPSNALMLKNPIFRVLAGSLGRRRA